MIKRIAHPEAVAAGNALARLIDVKDAAHYGFATLSSQKRTGAVKHAERLVAFAEDLIAA